MSSSRYPNTIADFVPWAFNHAETWKIAPTTIGLSSGQASSLDTACKTLNAAYANAVAARQASKNATDEQNTALRAVLTLIQQDIRIIDAFAENSANPAAVYTTAQIDAPPTPAPVPAPGAVTEISVGINIVSGAPILKWKGNNPGGSNNVSYIVKRKLPGEANYVFVGVSGSSGPDARTFTDETLPQGVDSVNYTITAQRGSVAGPATQVSIRFGVIGNGQMQVQVQSVKLAA